MTIDEIGKKMPFKEEQSYVDLLLADATASALRSGHPVRQSRPLLRIAAMLIVLLTVGSTGWVLLHQHHSDEAPLDTFLDNISEEEVSLLRDYCASEALTHDWEWDDNEPFMD